MGTEPAEGLRERKKRQTKQQLSDTATQMFLAQGFDAVRVSEIAEACGVSEKTVFNYFPTKEALIMDRFQTAPQDLRAALTAPDRPPVEAMVRLLADELSATTFWLTNQPDFLEAAGQVERFGTLLWSTPSLRAYQREQAERLTSEAARVLAARADRSEDDAEVLAAATALVGLWVVYYAALRKRLPSARSARQLHDDVAADLRRAAAVVNDGLNAWPA